MSNVIVHHKQTEMLAFDSSRVTMIPEQFIRDRNLALETTELLSKLYQLGAIEPDDVDFTDKFVVGRIKTFLAEVRELKIPICCSFSASGPVSGTPLSRNEVVKLTGRNILPDELARRNCLIAIVGNRKASQLNQYWCSRQHLLGLMVIVAKAEMHNCVQSLINIKAEDAELQRISDEDNAKTNFQALIKRTPQLK